MLAGRGAVASRDRVPRLVHGLAVQLLVLQVEHSVDEGRVAAASVDFQRLCRLALGLSNSNMHELQIKRTRCSTRTRRVVSKIKYQRRPGRRPTGRPAHGCVACGWPTRGRCARAGTWRPPYRDIVDVGLVRHDSSCGGACQRKLCRLRKSRRSGQVMAQQHKSSSYAAASLGPSSDSS